MSEPTPTYSIYQIRDNLAFVCDGNGDLMYPDDSFLIEPPSSHLLTRLAQQATPRNGPTHYLARTSDALPGPIIFAQGDEVHRVIKVVDKGKRQEIWVPTLIQSVIARSLPATDYQGLRGRYSAAQQQHREAEQRIHREAKAAKEEIEQQVKRNLAALERPTLASFVEEALV